MSTDFNKIQLTRANLTGVLLLFTFMFYSNTAYLSVIAHRNNDLPAEVTFYLLIACYTLFFIFSMVKLWVNFQRRPGQLTDLVEESYINPLLGTI